MATTMLKLQEENTADVKEDEASAPSPVLTKDTHILINMSISVVQQPPGCTNMINTFKVKS